MFIWEFVAGTVLDEITDWLHGKVVGFFSQVFTLMDQSVLQLFELGWVQSLLLFFRSFAWALFVVGLVVAVFEFVIEYQTGGAKFQSFFLNSLKGFFAVSTFTLVPIELYRVTLTLETSLIAGLTDTGGFLTLASNIVDSFVGVDAVDLFSSGAFGDSLSGQVLSSPFVAIAIIIMMCYAVIKVFFSCLKRGGILIIQIAVGTLYMFSVPRGYLDGFTAWCKQIIALCLTTFLQTLLITGGLLTLKDHPILGIGIMLSAKEVPRIAGMFGLDTSARTNIGGAVHTAHGAANLVKTIGKSAMSVSVA